MGFSNVDPNGNPVTVINQLVNFGWEYVWHCHLLGHEENDMMRAMVLAVVPDAPSNLVALVSGQSVILNWTDNSLNETGFNIQRAMNRDFTIGLTTFTVGQNVITYTDTTVVPGTIYYYRVQASNVVGSTVPGYPTMTVYSAFANVVNNAFTISGTVKTAGGIPIPGVTVALGGDLIAATPTMQMEITPFSY
jgi:hypothetical protein